MMGRAAGLHQGRFLSHHHRKNFPEKKGRVGEGLRGVFGGEIDWGIRMTF